MRKARIFVALAACVLLASGLAQAADGKWQINLKALDVLPSVNNDANADAELPEDVVDASDEWTPELDIKYYFNEKWAIELVLANPEHDVEVEGAGKIGTVKLLPPTISVQYHFLTDGKFQPYLGAGVNITTFSADLPEGLDVSSTSFGPAIGAGINWFLNDNWLINADVKYAMISGDLEAGGQKISTVDIDPLLVGVGVGYRF